MSLNISDKDYLALLNVSVMLRTELRGNAGQGKVGRDKAYERKLSETKEKNARLGSEQLNRNKWQNWKM